jgi:ferredoxin
MKLVGYALYVAGADRAPGVHMCACMLVCEGYMRPHAWPPCGVCMDICYAKLAHVMYAKLALGVPYLTSLL